MRSFLILLLVSIVSFAVAMIIMYSDSGSTVSTVSIPQMTPPYKDFVAGTGLVESSSQNIPISANFSGRIGRVMVKSGDQVKKGDLLFELDSSELRGKIAVLKRAITDKQEEIRELEKQLKFYNVYAPIDGKVLMSRLSVGEYFDVNAKQPLLILGSNDLNLRVSINEYDVWKFKPHTEATAFVRGHPELKVKLFYNYTEPFIVPKTALSGLSTEKTDTRVLQILYTIPQKVNFPLFVGEQLDVFIEVK
jgi:HlyD family secretion protein